MSNDLRQFRRTSFPWRTVVALGLSAAFLLLRCNSPPPPNAALDVTQLAATSGTFPLLRVTNACDLEVEVEDSSSSSKIEQDTHVVPVQLLGIKVHLLAEAVTYLRSRFASTNEIELRFDRRRIGPDSRVLLAYAFHEDICVNVELVRQGFASDETHPSDAGPMIRKIKKAEQEAKHQRRGVWSD